VTSRDAPGRLVTRRASSDSADGLTLGAVLTSLELEDALLVDPGSGRSGRGSLRVEDGIVTSVRWADGADGADGTEPVVVVAPGFVDLHAHLREPGGEDAETFATGLSAAAHGGFTFVCTMADTRPTLDRPEVVQRVVSAAAAAGSAVR